MALLTIIIPQIVGKKRSVRYSRGAGQIYSQNVLFPCPPTAAVSLLSVWLSWLFSPMARQGWAFLFSMSGAHSSEPAFCVCWPRSVPLPRPSAPLSPSFSSALLVAFPLFSLPFGDGGLKSQQRRAAHFHTSHFPSNPNSAAGVGKAFPSAQGFPW